MSANSTHVTLEHENVKVTVYKYGATVTSWKINNDEQLFTSSKAVLNGTKAIRGGYEFEENHAGIPVVWPQFGKPEGAKMAQHAFARNSFWDVASTSGNQLIFKLNKVPEGYDWQYKFELEYKVSVSGNSLTCELSATNLDEKPFEFTSLLHTYFKINNLMECKVSQLSDEVYDKVQGKTRKQTMPVVFKNEVDLVFMDAPNISKIEDGNRVITVEKKCFNDFVVWNPHNKAASMADLEEGGEKHFICVEAGSVWKPVELQPKKTWTGGMTLTVSDS